MFMSSGNCVSMHVNSSTAGLQVTIYLSVQQGVPADLT